MSAGTTRRGGSPATSPGAEKDANDAEYPHPYIAFYDAQTLRSTGVSYPLPREPDSTGVEAARTG